MLAKSNTNVTIDFTKEEASRLYEILNTLLDTVDEMEMEPEEEELIGSFLDILYEESQD